MRKISLTVLVITASLFSTQAYSQKADSLKQEKIKYISKDLSLPEGKAAEVVLILDQYKDAAKKVINDKSLGEDARRAKLETLIDDKNSKLSKIIAGFGGVCYFAAFYYISACLKVACN